MWTHTLEAVLGFTYNLHLIYHTALICSATSLQPLLKLHLISDDPAHPRQLCSSLVTNAQGRLLCRKHCSFCCILTTTSVSHGCMWQHTFSFFIYRLVKNLPPVPYFSSLIALSLSVSGNNLFTQAWQEEMVLIGLSLAQIIVLTLPLKVAIFSSRLIWRITDNNLWK